MGLDAEHDLGVRGPLCNFTATFSYAICAACRKFKTSPALGQMAELHDAMHHPEKYGYTPKHNITEAYLSRWMHSFNTQNPATDLQHQFLDGYSAAFPTTPVYIGEYHRVNANQTEDLNNIFNIVGKNPLFLGISFFEFTVSYYKTGSEMDFGMMGYGKQSVRSMDYFGHEYPVRCLAPESDVIDGVASSQSIAEAVARVYGGHVDRSLLCGGGSGTPLPEDTTSSPSSSRSSP